MVNISEGDEFPPFSLLDDSGKKVTNADLKKGKPSILYFYPMDDTPGCTKEACNFRDNLERFRSLGIPVYGVSVDDAESHGKFKKKYNLNFPLLSDPKKSLVESLGIASPSGKAQRVSFVLDKDGKVAKIYPKVSPDQHANEILSYISSSAK